MTEPTFAVRFRLLIGPVWYLFELPSRPEPGSYFYLCLHFVSSHFKHLLPGKRGVERQVWMSQQGWGSLCSNMKHHIWMSNAVGGGLSWGPAQWALVERCSQGGNRFSGKGQACELSAHRIQPPELWAFILGNNVGFIICKNGGSKTGLSCSESCTSRDHLSALIESQGCSAGGDAQPNGPDKHTYIRTKVNFEDLSACSLKTKKGGSTWRREDVGFDIRRQGMQEDVFLHSNAAVIFCSKHCHISAATPTANLRWLPSLLCLSIFPYWYVFDFFFFLHWTLKKLSSRSLCLSGLAFFDARSCCSAVVSLTSASWGLKRAASGHSPTPRF